MGSGEIQKSLFVGDLCLNFVFQGRREEKQISTNEVTLNASVVNAKHANIDRVMYVIEVTARRIPRHWHRRMRSNIDCRPACFHRQFSRVMNGLNLFQLVHRVLIEWLFDQWSIINWANQ